MKTSLEHLPEEKQEQLERAAEIVLEMSSPEMIILFGSYARGDWVEELGPDEFYYKYQSDFDLLVVTEHDWQARKIERDGKEEDRMARAIKTPITLIAHDIGFINRRLRKSQYFFSDIAKEGISLHDSGRFELAEPQELMPKERLKLAEDDFTYWFGKSAKLDKAFRLYIDEGDNSEAAFMLHQAT